MNYPTSISESRLSILGVELVVHQLDNGQRIIETESLNALFQAMSSGKMLTQEESALLAKVVK